MEPNRSILLTVSNGPGSNYDGGGVCIQSQNSISHRHLVLEIIRQTKELSLISFYTKAKIASFLPVYTGAKRKGFTWARIAVPSGAVPAILVYTQSPFVQHGC